LPDISLQNRIEMHQRKSEDEQSPSSNQETILFTEQALKTTMDSPKQLLPI
jgi:hypothetical protein